MISSVYIIAGGATLSTGKTPTVAPSSKRARPALTVSHTTHHHNIVNYFIYHQRQRQGNLSLLPLRSPSGFAQIHPTPRSHSIEATFLAGETNYELFTTLRVKRSRTRAMATMISQKNALLFTAVTGFGYGLQFMPELPSASTDRANAFGELTELPMRDVN